MKKLNIYGGIVLFVVFLYSGYILHQISLSHAANNPARISSRAHHIYLLLIVLLNLLAYRVDFHGRCKLLEPAARSSLLLAGLGAAGGFFMPANGTSAVHKLMSPAAVVLAFLSVALFLLDAWWMKK